MLQKLKEDESLTHVYFNESGGWLLNKNSAHPISKTRDEILSNEDQYSEEEETDEGVDVTEYLQELEKENADLKQQVEELQAKVAELEASKK